VAESLYIERSDPQQLNFLTGLKVSKFNFRVEGLCFCVLSVSNKPGMLFSTLFLFCHATKPVQFKCFIMHVVHEVDLFHYWSS